MGHRGDRRPGDPCHALRVAVRPAPEPQAVARAGVPGGRGAAAAERASAGRAVASTDAAAPFRVERWPAVASGGARPLPAAGPWPTLVTVPCGCRARRATGRAASSLAHLGGHQRGADHVRLLDGLRAARRPSVARVARVMGSSSQSAVMTTSTGRSLLNAVGDSTVGPAFRDATAPRPTAGPSTGAGADETTSVKRPRSG